MEALQASRHAHIKELKVEGWTNAWVQRLGRIVTRTLFEQIGKLLDHPMVGISA
jgi:hypothetical protein